MKLYVMRIQCLQWEYIELFSPYFVNWEEKLFMHQVGVKILTQDSLLNFIILDHLLLLLTSIAKEKMVLGVVAQNNCSRSNLNYRTRKNNHMTKVISVVVAKQRSLIKSFLFQEINTICDVFLIYNIVF